MDIGRYTILGPLGRGGMGRVYKVRHRMSGRIMALKRLEPPEILVDLMGETAVRESFLREARLLAGCDHRNIAPVWDLDEHRGQPFMVLEYLCMNVGALIGEGAVVEAPTRAVPARTALDFVRQTLDGLGYLHDRGILHLDVKPANLMLAADGTVRLIDMGLSRLRGEAWHRPRGMKVGSPFYAAPEQEAEPETADARADLYSVGVILHRLVTGLLPEDGISEAEFFSDVWRDRPGHARGRRRPGSGSRRARRRGLRPARDGLRGHGCVARGTRADRRGAVPLFVSGRVVQAREISRIRARGDR
jgi:serine/threonine-protein kinase